MDCGTPPDIVNATTDYDATTFGAEAKFVCDDSLTLVGGEMIVCQSSAMWSDASNIVCKSKWGIMNVPCLFNERVHRLVSKCMHRWRNYGGNVPNSFATIGDCPPFSIFGRGHIVLAIIIMGYM